MSACALGDLLSPGPGEAAGDQVASLTVAPAETTLAEPGNEFCYRSTVRDATGAVLDVTPAFSLDPASPSLVAFTEAAGCVQAVARGAGTPARIVARAGSAEAQAFIWVRAESGGVVATLEIFPTDTTLTQVGDRVCYRWNARDAAGDTLAVVPVFSLRANPGGRLHQGEGDEAHCFSVLTLAVVNTTVDAVTDSASASATLRVRP